MQLIFDVLGWIFYKILVFAIVSIVFVSGTAFYHWVTTLELQDLPPLTEQTQQILKKIPVIAFNDPKVQEICTDMSKKGKLLQSTSQDFLQRQQAPNPFRHPFDYYMWKTAEQAFINTQNQAIAEFDKSVATCNQYLIDEHDMAEKRTKDELASKIQEISKEQETTLAVLNLRFEKIKELEARLNRLKETRPNPANPLNAVAYYQWRDEKDAVNSELNTLNSEKRELTLKQVLQAKVIQHLQDNMSYSADESRLQQKITDLNAQLSNLKRQHNDIKSQINVLKQEEPYWIQNPFSSWLDKYEALINQKDTLITQQQQIINEKNRLEKLKADGVAQFSPLNTLLNLNDVLWNTFKTYLFSTFFLAFMILFGNLLQKSFWYFVIAKQASYTKPITID
ncbi:hypothetical protein BegalDRAFT_2579 [Beggiatoa alba B18LD]|uniref:Uncharacterized protein n=1 Tax=Beggiatoa alba B18LD TaxID=395493 RepID=I3CIH9_9GAMM|nr:hypothetical protein [Beggiatoa alba]EIJ43422.1 hypothetical protein BegalDRAFT_2579 [Beggiatoa alba B18LD]